MTISTDHNDTDPQPGQQAPAEASAAANPITPIREAIILAGGLGTRLRSAVPDLPKCMAPVAGKPFVAHVIDHYRRAGIERFIFALGYKSDYFDEFLERILPAAAYAVSREAEPLGTGGAILLACSQTSQKHVIVLNGDTFFGIDTQTLGSFHHRHDADCSLCLKPMREFDRYGAVELAPDGRVTAFREKQYLPEGLINGGVYALNAQKFIKEDFPEKFSFEKDYLERQVTERQFFGLIQDRYFIDIGIPADYERAQHEMA